MSNLIVLSQVLLLGLKLAGVITCSWWLVFIPVYIALALFLLMGWVVCTVTRYRKL
jgi:hypothetical protein